MKLVKKLLFSLLFLISVLIVIMAFNKVILKSDYFLGYRISIILTGSMEPELKINDMVLIKKTDKFKENDIVVYKNKNIETIHRVIEINDDEVITKGDNNNQKDVPIKKEQITGKYIRTIPGGKILAFFRIPEVMLVAIIIATIVLIVLLKKK